MNKKITTSFLYKTILILIFMFPTIIVLRSSAINISTTIVSIIMLFYILKKNYVEILKDKLVIYIIIFFTYIFINSIINFTSFDLLLKTLGNFRYLLLSVTVFFILKKISDRQKKFYIYFNLIIISLIALDIFYQFIFYKDIFGFSPGMCSDILPIECVRFSGIFGDELIAGAYLSQIGFLILILFLNLEIKKNFFNFSIKVFLSLFLFIIILITGERAALLILILSLFFIFFLKEK